MPVTISGSTGIQNVLGSASAPAESNTTSSNTGLYFPTSTTLGLSTAGTNALYVDASQNVGIGTTSPGNKLSVASTSFCNVDVLPAAANNGGINIKPNGSFVVGLGTAGNYLGGGSVSDGTVYSNANLILGTNASERMRIDSSGNLLVGMSSVSPTTNGATIQGAGGTLGLITSCLSSSTNAVQSYLLYSTGASAYRFYVDMGGTIHATATSITAISDQSLKTNIKPLETGLAEIMKLQPRRFDWINGDGENKAGFIAQEVEQVLPDLVAPFMYNEKETKLGLKMGDMIPTLVKAIQELKAEFDAYKASHP